MDVRTGIGLGGEGAKKIGALDDDDAQKKNQPKKNPKNQQKKPHSYGFNMSVIKALAMAEPLVDVVEPDQVVAEKPCLLHSLDMAAMPPAAGQLPGYASAFSSPFELTAGSNNYIHALVAYFDVEFSACHKPLRFATGPDARPTHWKQTVFYLEDTLVVKKGETVRGTFSCAPNAQNPRDLDIVIEYELDGAVCKAKRRQEYRMR